MQMDGSVNYMSVFLFKNRSVLWPFLRESIQLYFSFVLYLIGENRNWVNKTGFILSLLYQNSLKSTHYLRRGRLGNNTHPVSFTFLNVSKRPHNHWEFTVVSVIFKLNYVSEAGSASFIRCTKWKSFLHTQRSPLGKTALKQWEQSWKSLSFRGLVEQYIQVTRRFESWNCLPHQARKRQMILVTIVHGSRLSFRNVVYFKYN
jgi:hypothetical protein